MNCCVVGVAVVVFLMQLIHTRCESAQSFYRLNTVSARYSSKLRNKAKQKQQTKKQANKQTPRHLLCMPNIIFSTPRRKEAGEEDRESEKEKQTDKKTEKDRQTGRQVDRHTETCRQADRQADRQGEGGRESCWLVGCLLNVPATC